MNARVLRAYMQDCERYGWTPNVAGLKVYASSKYMRLRRCWALEGELQ